MSRLTLVITVIGLLIGLIVFYPRITYAEDPFQEFAVVVAPVQAHARRTLPLTHYLVQTE